MIRLALGFTGAGLVFVAALSAGLAVVAYIAGDLPNMVSLVLLVLLLATWGVAAVRKSGL